MDVADMAFSFGCGLKSLTLPAAAEGHRPIKIRKDTKLPASVSFLTGNPQYWFVIAGAYGLERRQ